MLEFEFMRHAFLGCALVSLIAGPVGWFLALRRQGFAAHALPHIGFSGAAAAIWFNVSALGGMMAASLLGGLIMGCDQEGKNDRRAQRDTTIGLVLAASLGLGLWFLHGTNSASSRATALLFGDVLGLDRATLLVLAGIVAVCLALLALLFRPLLFSSLSPQVAAAKGVPVRGASLGFVAVAALASAASAEITGALLAFSLMIGPPSVALNLGLRPMKGMLLSVVLSLALSWTGLVLAWFTDAPVSFWIGAGAALLYGGTVLVRKILAQKSVKALSFQ